MNIYLSLIQEISHQNKYTNWYINIISNALDRGKLNEYTEKHHILPKSFNMGGENDIGNIAILTAREHFIVHMLLVKMTVDVELRVKMACALTKMFDDKYCNSKTYETARKIFSKNHPMFLDEIKQKVKNTNLERYGCTSPAQNEDVLQKTKETNLERYGCETPLQNEEVKQKIKESVLEKYGVENPLQNEEVKQKLKQTKLERYGDEKYNNIELHKETIMENYGVTNVSQLPHVRKVVSDKMKARRANDKTVTCPHCGLVGKGPNMKRYHFDNCKKKPKD